MEKFESIEISSAIAKELERIPRWKAMFYLQENGETTVYNMSKELDWTPSKAHSAVRSLEKANAVETKVKLNGNGRAVKLVKLK